MAKIKSSLAYKVYLIVISSIASCALLIGVYYYVESKTLIREEIGDELQKKARTVAVKIDGNLLDSMTSPQDFFYEMQKIYLPEIKSQNDIEVPINIFKRKTSTYASLVLTTEPNNLFGAEYRINPTMKQAFNTGKTIYSPIYADKDGTWISAYSPVKNKDGLTVGVLELNREIGYYIRALGVRLLKIFALCFCGCFAGILLGIPLLKPILLSINMLSRAAHEIEGGNYDGEIKSKSSDEIGRLADDLEKMRLSFKRYIQQLKDAQDEVVRSEKLAAIGKLAGIVSHELRSPLAAINSSAYYLKTRLDKMEDEKIEKHLGILESEVNAADKIIGNILNFARPKEPIFVETDINEVMKISIRKADIAQGVEVTTRFEDETIKIPADGNQLCQVFFNLISNAVQAMPGGGRLTIETGRVEGFAEVHIIDTGVGIPKENLKKIFDPLFSTKPKGTGLGMSVCQGIVEKHRGALLVESEVGKGTKFTVRLPVKKES